MNPPLTARQKIAHRQQIETLKGEINDYKKAPSDYTLADKLALEKDLHDVIVVELIERGAYVSA